MANTITYDPSDDPQAIAEREVTDSENIKVAEEMIKEEQDLLAGKYKNAEELERAYLELQQKLGEDKPETEEVEQEDEPEYENYLEDGSVDYDTVKERYGEGVGTQLEKAGIDPWVMNEYFDKNEGTLTPEMIKQLETAGFAQPMVESYLQGIQQQRGYNQAQKEELSDAEVTNIQNLAGGKEGYSNLTNWASENLPQEELDAFDDVIRTGNKSAVTFAVKALNAQYEDSVGKQPSLVTGKTPRSGATYRSMAEVVRDMSDPRYEQDEAYRMDIQSKLERSNMKV